MLSNNCPLAGIVSRDPSARQRFPNRTGPTLVALTPAVIISFSYVFYNMLVSLLQSRFGVSVLVSCASWCKSLYLTPVIIQFDWPIVSLKYSQKIDRLNSKIIQIEQKKPCFFIKSSITRRTIITRHGPKRQWWWRPLGVLSRLEQFCDEVMSLVNDGNERSKTCMKGALDA